MAVRTDAEVSQIIVRQGRAKGVLLKNGERIEAPIVISNASARHTFLDLVEPDALPDDFVRHIRRFNGRATSFKVHLAVSELPRYVGLEASDFDQGCPAQVTVAPSVTYLEDAYRDMIGGRLSRRPYMTVLAPTIIDPALAPDGHHQLSIYGGHIPAEDGEEQKEQRRKAVLDVVLDTLSIYAPNISRSVLHSQVMLPSDYETIFGLPGGNPHHADLTLDQLFFRRPAPRFAGYSSPVRGLFLCGASTHPGGGVTGISGYNAAKTVLKAMRRRMVVH
jgi:phytoene dehydrogenase-like protein